MELERKMEWAIVLIDDSPEYCKASVSKRIELIGKVIKFIDSMSK